MVLPVFPVRWLLLSLISLWASVSVAWAENMRVTLLLAPGDEMVSFTLTTEDSATFRKKWGALSTASVLIPLSANPGYHGVLLRGDQQAEFRLFEGVGHSSSARGPSTRKDDLRLLERWVLDRAPPPLGPSLVAALDEDVATRTNGMVFPETYHRSAASLIEGCKADSRGNPSLQASCLHRALGEKMNPADYVTALEDLLRKADEPMAVPVSPGKP